MTKAKIMIVEDEITIALDIKIILQHLNYQITSIEHQGEQAVEKAGLNKPDLILMDIQLAGDMDGIEAAKKIREIFNIPVIYLTAQSNKDLVDRIKLSYPFGYLLKPIKEKELFFSIEIALYIHKLELDLKESNKHLQKEINIRKQNEDELRRYKEQLEKLVRKRTSKLRKTNEELETQISERLKTDEKLRNSEQRYRNLVETMNEGLGVVDQEEKISYVNPRLCEMLGYDNLELIGQPIHRFLDKTNLVILRKRLTNRKQELQDSYEIEWTMKNGGLLPTIMSPKVIYDKDDALIGIFAVITDITERKKNEAMIEEWKNRYEAAIMASGKLLYDWDLVTNDVTYAGDIKKILGYSTKKMEGGLNKWIELIHPDDVDYFTQNIDYIIKTKESAHLEYRIRKKDDSYILVLDEGNFFFNNTENVNRMIGFITDITEAKKVEEIMIQTEKMMSLGGLAAGMAHEINNPLGGILQASQNILRRISPKLNKNSQVAAELGSNLDIIYSYLEKRGIITFIAEIREAAKRASNIISNMLRFSRQSQSNTTYTDIHQLIEHTIDLASKDYDLHKQYDFRHIKIKRDFDPNISQIPIIATEIEQVIFNLLINSAQAFNDSKTDIVLEITISTKLVDNMVRIEIEDNGPGMNPEVRKKVFEPFFTTKEKEVGTGLGLSVSYMIVTNNHKGKMSVESTLGTGSKFIIILPKE